MYSSLPTFPSLHTPAIFLVIQFLSYGLQWSTVHILSPFTLPAFTLPVCPLPHPPLLAFSFHIGPKFRFSLLSHPVCFSSELHMFPSHTSIHSSSLTNSELRNSVSLTESLGSHCLLPYTLFHLNHLPSIFLQGG